MPAPSNEALAPITPALSRDMTLMLARLRVELIQASIIAVDTLATVASWCSVPDDKMDVHGPLAAMLLPKLEGMAASHTVSHELGPDYWAYAWRFDDRHAVLATAFYRDRREMRGSAETALLRLVCDIGLSGEQVDTQVPEVVPTPMTWPAVERRRKVRATHARRSLLFQVTGALLVGTLTLAATSLTFHQAVAQQAGATQLQTLAEGAMTHTLSAALATGDYGEVQSALSPFASLGYFKGAVVTNPRQRVVSAAGKVGTARVGDEVPPSLVSAARSFDLGAGTAQHGQLLVVGMTAEQTGAIPLRWLLLATVLGCLATGVLAALLGIRCRWHLARKALA